jgi:predicted lipoprotein with Yx(FWY)xxD motif
MKDVRQPCWVLLALALLLLLNATACIPGAVPILTPAYTANVAGKSGGLNYLVDGRGMTLYYFARDVVGRSNATAAILQTWPIYYAPNPVVPASLNAADFGTITRDDGQKQTTYKGWPLYPTRETGRWVTCSARGSAACGSSSGCPSTP